MNEIDNMMTTLKYFLIFASFFIGSYSFAQIDMEPFAGKRYGSLYKKIKNDSSFVSCRLLTATPNKVTGVELYFKNNVNYVVSFKKGRLNDGYDCDSFPIRGAKIYVIHKFKGKEYEEGYCRCKADEKGRIIKPTIQSETP